jgi:ribosomal protein S6
MFVVYNKDAQQSRDYLEEHLKRMLSKVGAELIRMTKWDERQLAYEINGQTDGIFYLTYFEASGSAIKDLRREAELSEIVLRLLVLHLDAVPAEEDVKGPRRRSEESESESGDSAKPGDSPKTEGEAKTEGAAKTEGEAKTEGAAKTEAAKTEAAKTEGAAKTEPAAAQEPEPEAKSVAASGNEKPAEPVNSEAAASGADD